MSDDQPVILEGIPVFTGDLALLDATVKELTKDGGKIATAAGDIHSSFGGLQAFYQAPEADQLFATTKPVADRGAALKSDLATITGALGTYSDEAYPLVEKLRQLKRDAGAFLAKVNADDKWREDGDLVEENNHRRDEIRETWAAFQAVERACYNKIIAMVPGGKQLTTNDGSNGKHMYGYDAEALKQAKGLPWGDPVKESTRWYQFYEHVWDFGKGFVVDGVWGTVKGLGTLFGTEGWDTAKQAWTGLGNLATGVVLTVAAPHVLWLTPEKDLPGFARDARNAMKETGKALIAYDQWGENPARAGGAVTFNVLTTVFTGGAGGGASGAGKAAAAAKALSFANKASRVVDPTTYLFKGAGAGLTKISDVMAGLKGTGNVEIPPLPAGAIALPDGAYKAADGTLTLPEGAAVPEAAFEIPKGSVKLPDGAEIPTGAVDLGDGIVRLPEGMAPPAGSLPIPEGTLKLPDGATALPENAVKLTTPDGKTVYVDREGSILAADGTLKQHHTDAPQGNPPTGSSTRTDADSPLPRTPAEQSALVGAGARGGSDTVRLGSDLGDAGRVGDDFGRTGDGATNPDRTPGGTANNVPTNSVDNGTPDGGSQGGRGGHIPANNLDGGSPTGAGGRDVQGGSTAGGVDSGVPGPRNADGGASGVAGSDSAPASAGATRQPVPRPSFMRDGLNPYGRPGSLTLDQIEDIQVYRANEDPGYREQYYRKDGTRRRVEVHDESGFAPPQLAQPTPGGPWVRAKDVPPPPVPHFLDEEYIAVGADTVTSRARLKLLDAAAEKRYCDIQWDNLIAKWKGDSATLHEKLGTPETAAEWAEARGTYKESHTQMGKSAEDFGEKAAEHHFIAERYSDFENQPLLGPKNGNDQFDQVWKHEDGRIVVIEAKSSTGTELGSRRLPNGKQVSQGSREYFLDIIEKMRKRGERDTVRALERAMENGNLEYVVIKGNKNTGTYTGYEYRRFDISKGTLP
ncbi:hypothetical protein [Streptomyces sp. st140]|uniref:hypothetical protein n=1 Tax=Streptomyces sp. st140 TaxID=1828052 RepID=UPI000BEF3258|nr:hypothetical protein [Streptomyces sp. st140]